MAEQQTYKKVIIAGGGTGGHIFPAIAIAHALQRQWPGVKLLFVGALGKMEMEQVPKAGFEIIGLDIAGFNRSNIFKNWSLPFKLIQSRAKALRILKDFRPDAVVGVGGYASFPMLSAAQKMGMPTLIQEQNSFAGKSNKILGRKAKAICVAYEGMERFFPKEKITMTGNPVRHVIANSTVSQAEGLAAFGLDGQKKTLLIVGGSLGARSINQAIKAGLSKLAELNLQVIWQTGKLFFEEAKAAVAEQYENVLVKDFIAHMEYAYAAADVVISRAGALASAELCIAARPVIFVPYPYAAEDHQTSNAMALVNHNAALMVKDNEVQQELISKLEHLLTDERMQDIMSEELKQLAIKDADDRIAKKISEIIE